MTLQTALSTVSGGQENSILYLRSIVANECPMTVKALRFIDHEYTTPRRYKGYNLTKREHKKLGFVYYVRYWHEGSMLPSKWCTHTNDYEQACKFAVRNRETLISRYLGKNGGEAIRFFSKFYDARSPVFQSESRRNGWPSEERRIRGQRIMEYKFIPFLKEQKINRFEEITVPVLDDFQDALLANGLKAKSVNEILTAVNKAFRYLMRKGMIHINPFQNLTPVPDKPDEKKTHGCYELSLLKGIFNKRWKDHVSYMLNLIVYTTNMRNSEIALFSKKDIVTIQGIRFIDLKKSKTENGVRLVPLHENVYRKIRDYVKTRGIDESTPIFGDASWHSFTKAYRSLGKALKVSDDFLKEKNITFYSGRHFWKTLMSDNGLGENVEEFFMGHKVSGNVAKLYNHHDAKGQKLLVEKAREIFRILDSKLFT